LVGSTHRSPDVLVALAVAVGVDDDRRPACEALESPLSRNFLVFTQPITPLWRPALAEPQRVAVLAK